MLAHALERGSPGRATSSRRCGPHAGERVYVNFLGDEGAERVRQAYGDRQYERLVELKRAYDPTNFFRLNQNIEP
jgi:hypothetical protein